MGTVLETVASLAGLEMLLVGFCVSVGSVQAISVRKRMGLGWGVASRCVIYFDGCHEKGTQKLRALRDSLL
jgi:hypothetical protein